MKNIFYLLIITLLCFENCSGCKDDCSSGNLQFDLPLQVYGIKDTLHFGDTIRIKLDIPDKLNERRTGVSYDFIDYNFKLITYNVKIDSLPAISNTIETFNWKTLNGESKYIADAYLIFPKYSNHTYQYEAIFTPKQKGLFVFGMNSTFSNRTPLLKVEGPCSKYPVEVYMKLENDTNTNFEFLKQSPDMSQSNLDRQRFDEFAGFCFYVR